MHPLYNEPRWVPALYPKNHSEARMRKNPGNQERRDKLMDTYENHKKNFPDHYIGYIASKDDRYVLIDIDPPKELKQLEPTPQVVRGFIKSLPDDLQRLIDSSYTETSASGIGLRVFVRIKPDSILRTIDSNWVKALSFEGQVNLHDGYMICTQNVWTDKESVTVADAWFERNFKIPAQKVKTHETEENKNLTAAQIQQLIGLDLLTRLQSLPLDPNNQKVRRAYERHQDASYEHYEYWRLVAAATRDYAEKTGLLDQGFDAFHIWSQKDDKAYISEDDCLRTWNANPPKESGITYRTLLLLLSDLEYAWPEPIIRNGEILPYPVETSHKNFCYFLEFHNITLYKSTAEQFYLTGDDHILQDYFEKPDSGTIIHGKTLGQYYGPFSQQDLTNIMAALMQARGYGSKLKTETTKVLLSTCISRSQYKNFNLMQAWLQTPFDELPKALQYIDKDGEGNPVGRLSQYDENSNIDYIVDQFSLHPLMPGDNAKDILRKSLTYFFMGMAKLLTQHKAGLLFDENAGMLLLIGGEGTRKTTFFKFLVPKPLQDACVFIPKGFTKDPSEKQMRDLYRRVATSGYIVFDEFDAIPQAFIQAEMKKFISDNSFQFTEIYSSMSTTLPRHASIGGTTNDFDLRFSDNGNRRIWAIIVGDYNSHTKTGGINTNALLRFNWHKFYNDMIDQFDKEVRAGKTPWLPTTQDIAEFEEVHKKVSAETNLSMVLQEVYPYTSPFTGHKNIKNAQTKGHPYIKTITEISNDLVQAGVVCSRPELKRALKRYCGEYTQTRGKTYEPLKKKWIITDGQLIQGPHRRWIVPTKKAAFEAEEGDLE